VRTIATRTHMTKITSTEHTSLQKPEHIEEHCKAQHMTYHKVMSYIGLF
jgi:hypothetical protein